MADAPTTTATKDPAQLLEELRTKHDQREKERKADADRLELAELQLEEKLEAELGKRGHEFQIVRTELGVIGVKLGDFVVFKRFDAVPLEKKGPEEVFQFVLPCVVSPPRDEAVQIFQRRPGIAYRCARALLDLFSGKKDETTGKY